MPVQTAEATAAPERRAERLGTQQITAAAHQPPQIEPAPAQQPASAPQPEPQVARVPAEKLAAYLAVLDVYDRNPAASTDDLVAATASSRRTVESRRAELVKLGVLHRTPDGFERNGVQLVEE